MSRLILAAFVLLILVITAVPLLFRSGAETHTPPAIERLAEDVGLDPPSAPPLRDVPAEVDTLLRAGRHWRAARAMREYLERRPDASPAVILVAARAEAGWGGWDRVRVLLEEREWLDHQMDGEGWFWLARALEHDQEWNAANAAYERYLAADDARLNTDRRLVAELRRGLILLRTGDLERGTTALSAAREHAPGVAPWIGLLSAESLAERGDTARVRELLDALDAENLGIRTQRARVLSYVKAQDHGGARALALRYRAAASSDAARAEFSLAAARAAANRGDSAAARADLRAAMSAATGTAAALDAARLLSDLGAAGASDRLLIAQVFDRHGNNERAAAGYRAWLAAGSGSAAERRDVRLRLGRALFDAGEYAQAEDALQDLDGAPADVAAEALHLTGRAQYRRGRRTEAQRTFLRVAERYPRSNAGAEALFLVADLSHDAGELRRAREVYRRVAAEFPGNERAGLALMRLAGMSFLDREYTAAARDWEAYRSAYPRGQLWLQATYWAGRAYAAAGDTARARTRYREVRSRDPLSYYTLRSAERLGQPFWPIPMNAAPAESEAARERIDAWLHGIDLLRDAGLHSEAEAEVDRWVARVGDDPRLLYPLAEALNERGYTVQGIRLGLKLQRMDERYNPRLLRILYPFPYRAIIEAEAREKGLDPFLVAALTRQESMFKARISSPVGARGLMQIMPETGRQIAWGVDIRQWDPELLFYPEINVHMGTRYLADQMRAYKGSLPSVFSAYNAGPHRVERWKEFPEYGNEELFTERIPYRETRDYVKILIRNRALYQGLYGE
jgi:soluble lytic murein transglycosylase